MLSERLQQAVTGKVHFSVEGGFMPQFLTLCQQNQICIRHTKTGQCKLQGVVSRQDLDKLKAAAVQSGMELTVIKKSGLAFLLHRYRFRWGIPAGLVLAFLLLGLLSSVVWQVEVKGCETLSEEYIRSYFEELGVRPGVFQSSIDITQCRGKAILEIKELLWVTVYLKGCTACIEISERKGEVQLPEKGSTNLIASYGGEIIRADVYAGESYVKIGQAVAKGDLLVGGGVPLKNGGVRFVRSQADIFARTNRTLQTTVSLRQKCSVAEKTANRWGLYWFSLRVPLGLAFGKEISEESQSYICLSDTVLPIGIWRQGLRKTVEKEVAYSQQRALLQAFAAYALEELTVMEDKKIVQRSLYTACENGQIRVKGEYVCEENIVSAVELPINDGK